MYYFFSNWIVNLRMNLIWSISFIYHILIILEVLLLRNNSKDGQALIKDIQPFEKFAHLIGLKNDDFIKSVLTPAVKAGGEITRSGQSSRQVSDIRTLFNVLHIMILSWLNLRCTSDAVRFLPTTSIDEAPIYVNPRSTGEFRIFV